VLKQRSDLIQALAVVEWYAKEYARDLGAIVIDVEPERPSPLTAPVFHLEGER
jgi:hypothetical protein